MNNGKTYTRADNPNVSMNIRDWFAGQALAGLLADAERGTMEQRASGAAYARDAYRLADAMMAERVK